MGSVERPVSATGLHVLGRFIPLLAFGASKRDSDLENLHSWLELIGPDCAALPDLHACFFNSLQPISDSAARACFVSWWSHSLEHFSAPS